MIRFRNAQLRAIGLVVGLALIFAAGMGAERLRQTQELKGNCAYAQQWDPNSKRVIYVSGGLPGCFAQSEYRHYSGTWTWALELSSFVPDDPKQMKGDQGTVHLKTGPAVSGDLYRLTGRDLPPNTPVHIEFWGTENVEGHEFGHSGMWTRQITVAHLDAAQFVDRSPAQGGPAAP